MQKIDTPCIGICSTIYGDDICRGCKRSYQQVIDWNKYTSETRQDIFTVLNNEIEKVCSPILTVFDVEQLKEKLLKFNVRFDSNRPTLVLAFILLREGHDKINDISKYGIEIHPEYLAYSLTQIYQQLDQALLELAALRLAQ